MGSLACPQTPPQIPYQETGMLWTRRDSNPHLSAGRASVLPVTPRAHERATSSGGRSTVSGSHILKAGVQFGNCVGRARVGRNAKPVVSSLVGVGLSQTDIVIQFRRTIQSAVRTPRGEVCPGIEHASLRLASHALKLSARNPSRRISGILAHSGLDVWG